LVVQKRSFFLCYNFKVPIDFDFRINSLVFNHFCIHYLCRPGESGNHLFLFIRHPIPWRWLQQIVVFLQIQVGWAAVRGKPVALGQKKKALKRFT
jgi:hypothetical protein